MNTVRNTINLMDETTTQKPPANPARIALVGLGLVLIVVGGIVAIANGSKINDDSISSSYSQALGMGAGGAVTADTIGMWVGIGILVIGALLLLARLAISAARQ